MEISTLQVGKIYKTKGHSGERLKYIGRCPDNEAYLFEPLRHTVFVRRSIGKYAGLVGFIGELTDLSMFIEVND